VREYVPTREQNRDAGRSRGGSLVLQEREVSDPLQCRSQSVHEHVAVLARELRT
jgi:hypothetical protein